MAKRVLVVDDEPNIVDILRFNLEREGYEVITAEDGVQGLEMARSSDPDLILLDVMMPEMDGFEVCRELRREDKLTPIIMLTAREEEADRVMGLELGADDYVSKPFSVRSSIHSAVRSPFIPVRLTVMGCDCFEVFTTLIMTSPV